MKPPILFSATFLLLLTQNICAQNTADSTSLKLFLNCQYCYEDFVKTEIQWVDFVRDRFDADVDLLITTINTGAGGTEYCLFFNGQQKCFGMNDTIKFISNSINTEDETRRGLTQKIKMGLMRYLALSDKPIDFDIRLMSDSGDAEEQTSAPTNDPWNNWVFSINVDGNVNGQKQYQSGYISSGISANRTTEKIKINLNARASYNESRFDYGGEKSTYIQRNQNFNGNVIKSLTTHWSAGVFGSARMSDYSNYDLATDLSAAVEYNVFPYSEAQTRAITFGYFIGVNYYDFTDTTIYNMVTETKPRHSLRAGIDYTKSWGSINGGVNFSQFIDDMEKNRYGGYVSFDVRLFKGLSANVYFVYDVIHDQINLPKSGASDEDILLQQQELATSYEFFTFFGLNYRFGSIYNNVVNPRFD